MLLVEAQLIARTAGLAAGGSAAGAELLVLPNTLPHSIGGLVLLLVVQVLNVYKPQGLTPYGWRRQQAERASRGR